MDKSSVKSTKRNTAHLKPAWKPGQSGNPKGRPKKVFCIPDLIRAKGKEIDPESKMTYYDLMVKKAWEQATAGDKDARNWLTERTEGKPTQPIEFEQKTGEVIVR